MAYGASRTLQVVSHKLYACTFRHLGANRYAHQGCRILFWHVLFCRPFRAKILGNLCSGGSANLTYPQPLCGCPHPSPSGRGKGNAFPGCTLSPLWGFHLKHPSAFENTIKSTNFKMRRISPSNLTLKSHTQISHYKYECFTDLDPADGSKTGIIFSSPFSSHAGKAIELDLSTVCTIPVLLSLY